MKFKSDIEVQAGLKDSSGAAGTSGQVLSSNGTTVSWVNPGAGAANDVQNQVKAGVAINKGQAVYVTGADGTNIIVGLASNTSEVTSSKTLGLLNATVAANGFADVIQIGKLSGLNTIGAVIGDPVWLGTNGNLIYGLANKPYAPAHLVYIGVVTRVNANNGEIFVTVQNGFELKEIHDVDIITTTPTNGDVLGYNGSLWVNKTIPGWLGYTPANDANVVHLTGNETISGVKTFNDNIIANAFVKIGGNSTQYLKADGSVSTAMNSRVEANFVATSGQTTFVTPYEVGQIDVYYNGSKLYPNEFTATNGTDVILATGATLNAQISIVKYVSSLSTTAIRNETTFTTTAGQTTFAVNYSVGQVDVFYNGSKLNISEFTAVNGTSVVLGFACAAGESIVIDSYVNQISGASGTPNYVSKFTGAASLGDSQIFDNGYYVGIGTTTSTGSKLIVTGYTDFWNSTNTLLRVQHDGSRAMLQSFTSGGTGVISLNSSGGNVLIGTTTDSGYKLDVNGTSRFASVQTGSAGVLHPTTNTGTNASPSYENLISYTSSAVGTSQINGGNFLASTYGTALQFIVNSENNPNDPITTMTIRGRGTSASVGIGTSNPVGKLHVSGSEIHLTGTVDNKIRLSNYGFTGDSMGAAIGYIYRVANTQESGSLAFYTNPNFNGTGSLTERMRIDSNGTALFKRTSSLDPSYAAGFEGAIFFKTAVNGNNTVNFFNASTTYVASIVTNASSITYGTGSDYRLKEDLKDFNGLEKVSKIKVYDFKFIEEGDRMEGVLAHELQEVIPYAVSGKKDEVDEKGNAKIQNVDYSKLTPILVKAVQEQQEQIELLKAEIEILKNK